MKTINLFETLYSTSKTFLITPYLKPAKGKLSSFLIFEFSKVYRKYIFGI